MKSISRTLGIAALLGCASFVFGQKNYNIMYDDFNDGFSVNSPTAKWFYFAAGPFVGDDGIVSTSNKGLYVRAKGTNPLTGLPAFTLSVGQETDPFSLPGGFDHVKWLAYANHLASTGVPGFDAVPGQELTFETWIGGESYGNEQHPFGANVTDPDDDVRLAAPAMNTIDLESFLVSDFFMTNKRIYALYERLPFGRTPGHNYAAFTYVIPVATRKKSEMQHLSIAYDRSAGRMRWMVDGKEVFRVDHVGHRIDRKYMLLDHGGIEEDVDCRQRDIGFGTFTLLDGGTNGQPGLVQLSSVPDFYFNTALGEPYGQSFIDSLSLPNSRLWGEGADLWVKKVQVSSKAANGNG
ncbi:MAG: hypothetical protein GC165_18105 [Armatimonadetes bacterium]|nr:hypothetical protein [Armatimonadota bacterium]